MTRSRERSRAIAILMVVLILAALVAIATPFALSMGLHERKARIFRDTIRARLAAEGAVAHAVSVLRRTEDYAEETRRYGAPWNTPDFDTEEEFRVEFKFKTGAGPRLEKAGITFDDPRGLVWSVRVEDEQGKINILSAPRNVFGGLIASGTLARDLVPADRAILLDDASDFFTDGDPKTVDGLLRIGAERLSYRLVEGDSIHGLKRNLNGLNKIPTHGAGRPVYAGEAEDIGEAARRGDLRTLHDLKRYLGPEQFERIAPYVTTQSYRESGSGWLRREEVLNNFDRFRYTVTVRDADGLGPGTRVRFVVDTDVREEAYHVTRARRAGERWKITLETEVGFDRPKDESVFIEGEQRHPVNVNMAPLAVLRAILTGVAPSRGRAFRREEAMTLAQFVHAYVRGEVPGGKPLASEADIEIMFRSARENKILGDSLTHGRLQALVENATVGNSPNLRRSTLAFCFKSFGNFTIEAAAVVNTPAGEETARYVLRELVSLPVSSHGRRTLSSQKDFDEQVKRLVGRKVVTWPFVEPPTSDRDLKRYTRGLQPGTGSDPYGTVRLETGRCPDDGCVDHFEPGRRVFKGSYDLMHDGADLGGGTVWTSGSNVFKAHRGHCRPVLLEAWVKPDSASFTLFSAFKDPGKPRNGLDLKYQKGLFVLRIFDACLEQGTEKWKGPAEYTFQTDEITLGDWYHVALHVSGTGPNDATLCIDGRPVIEGVQADEVTYKPAARLVSIAPANKLTGCDVTVDDGTQFPEDGGAVLIDGEVIEYETRNGNTLSRCRRACRYTRLAKHAGDAIVVPYGYSVGIVDKVPGARAVIRDDGFSRNGSTCLKTKRKASGAYETLEDEPDRFEVEDGDVLQNSGFLWLVRRDYKMGGTKPKTFGLYIYYGEREDDELKDVEWRPYASELDVGGMYFRCESAVRVQQISIEARRLSKFKFPMRWMDDNMEATYLCIKVKEQTEVEWARREWLDVRGGKQYMMGWRKLRDNPQLYGPRRRWSEWRGRLGTVRFPKLPMGTEIHPVFRVGGPQCGNQETKHHNADGVEKVTICKTDNPSQAETKGITHASAHEYFTTGTKGRRPWYHRTVYRVSLDRLLDRDYEKGSARLMRFPSGEMPRGIPGRLTVGPVKGWVDEIRATSSRRKVSGSSEFKEFRWPAAVAFPDASVVQPMILPINADAAEIDVVAEILMAGDNTPVGIGNCRGRTVDVSGRTNEIPSSGVVRIDDELIYYDGWGGSGGPVVLAWGRKQAYLSKYCPWVNSLQKPCEPNCKRKLKVATLQNCVRGVLGTRAAEHLPGARVSFLSGFPLSTVTSPDTDKVTLKDAVLFPEEGYAVARPVVGTRQSSYFSGEIFGWTRKSGDALEGIEYLRGRFGTKEADIRGGDLVQFLPFRYWSRWVPERDGSELAFFQTSISARGARWRSVEWAEGLFDRLPVDGMEIRVVCRFDGEPGWETRPSNRPGGLWEFKGAGTHKLSTRGGAPLVADSIDVRVYFSYKPRAWAADSNDWKRTLSVENLTVTFGSPLVVRKVDLLDY